MAAQFVEAAFDRAECERLAGCLGGVECVDGE
jgi:hypothetical protein